MKEWESLSNRELDEVRKQLEKEVKDLASGGMNE